MSLEVEAKDVKTLEEHKNILKYTVSGKKQQPWGDPWFGGEKESIKTLVLEHMNELATKDFLMKSTPEETSN